MVNLCNWALWWTSMLWKWLTAAGRQVFSTKSSIIDIWQGPKCASGQNINLLFNPSVRNIEGCIKVCLAIFQYCTWKTECHCVKSVRIRNYSGPHFPAFGLNTESKCGKMRTRITPNTDTFKQCIVLYFSFWIENCFCIASNKKQTPTCWRKKVEPIDPAKNIQTLVLDYFHRLYQLLLLVKFLLPTH